MIRCRILLIDSVSTIWIWGAIAIAALLVAKNLARQFRRGWLRTIGLVPILILLTYVIAVCAVLAHLIISDSEQLFRVGTSMPISLVALLLELGLEMMAMPVLIVLPFFLWYRVGVKKPKSTQIERP